MPTRGACRQEQRRRHGGMGLLCEMGAWQQSPLRVRCAHRHQCATSEAVRGCQQCRGLLQPAACRGRISWSASHMPARGTETHACAADGANLLAGSTHSHGTHGLAAELAGAEGRGLGRHSGGSNHSGSHHLDRHRWQNVPVWAEGPEEETGVFLANRNGQQESRSPMSLGGFCMPDRLLPRSDGAKCSPLGRCGTAIAAEPHVAHGLPAPACPTHPNPH